MSWKDKIEEKISSEPVQKLTSERAQEMINELEDYETEWTKWESDFLSTISELLNRELFISDSRCDTLESIHRKYLHG